MLFPGERESESEVGVGKWKVGGRGMSNGDSQTNFKIFHWNSVRCLAPS